MRKWYWIVGVLSFAVAACQPVSVRPVKQYVLQSKNKVSNWRAPQIDSSLRIAMPVAAPGFATQRMLYMMTPFRLEAYTLNQWVAPPAQMLLPVLATVLRQSHRFASVDVPPYATQSDYQLKLKLIAFYQSFLKPVSSVHLVLHVALIRKKDRQLLADKTFEENQPAPGNNAYSGVLASNTAINRIALRIARFVIQSKGVV